MNMPQFTAEASLGPAKGIYRGKAAYGRSSAVEILPMLPRRPTVDSPASCFGGAGDVDCSEGGGLICSCCYDDGCWICDNWFGIPANCVWDDKYSKRGRPARALGGVFARRS
jgi:hypothetical protein